MKGPNSSSQTGTGSVASTCGGSVEEEEEDYVYCS
jgi:hypothetical protein